MDKIDEILAKNWENSSKNDKTNEILGKNGENSTKLMKF